MERGTCAPLLLGTGCLLSRKHGCATLIQAAFRGFQIRSILLKAVRTEFEQRFEKLESLYPSENFCHDISYHIHNSPAAVRSHGSSRDEVSIDSSSTRIAANPASLDGDQDSNRGREVVVWLAGPAIICRPTITAAADAFHSLIHHRASDTLMSLASSVEMTSTPVNSVVSPHQLPGVCCRTQEEEEEEEEDASADALGFEPKVGMTSTVYVNEGTHPLPAGCRCSQAAMPEKEKEDRSPDAPQFEPKVEMTDSHRNGDVNRDGQICGADDNGQIRPGGDGQSVILLIPTKEERKAQLRKLIELELSWTRNALLLRKQHLRQLKGARATTRDQYLPTSMPSSSYRGEVLVSSKEK
ncbi:hypothetical protein CBR_g28894 [Chara braunii]|uniref:Uncharacterized protein n=1 Tax=Chara braunii TaxID=69332 RepID=A0A388LA60_CHABU|nr:hypothetical protein CBR_g28894 [Chara braunii]|eukprot:GBG79178.1 hypothetical protein CBR_g28894 [Chara braunii]